MIEIKNKQIIIDGKPQIIMAGEIHYFRLDKKDWQDRIDKLKAAGCNAVSSYIPWICHEPREGLIDLVGKTRPQLDLISFIDLCKENGLYFLSRPGPFVMAEMKNEGIPYWVYEKHPEVIPVCWDNAPTSTKTVDYLAPGFLKEVHKWYKAVMQVIEPRLYTRGGNIIGVQLDNEIGMLSWVSNCPDFTENIFVDFVKWLKEKYDKKSLRLRYPFDIEDMESFAINIRSPKEEYALELFHDLGYYMRNRFARYVDVLRSYAEEFGVKDIPFFVNIHGTSSGRGLTFPIGISQLHESYTQKPGYIAGSDLYLGNLTMDNFQDLYIINSFMDAVNTIDQPLTSLEFECGDGNYGNTYGGRYDSAAVDLKTRMCIAQGNKLLNYYLFSGGINYILEPKPNDGNDRIATTGERHGFAAPISPEGEFNYTYPRMARIIKTVMSVSDKIASMKEEHDEVAFAFIPDYYMTEHYYIKSKKMKDIIENLTKNRAYSAWETMIRAILLANYRFGSIDIQNKFINPKDIPVLVVASARYMDRNIQQKLVDYMVEGGNILLYGEVPQLDMEGKSCTIFADAINVEEIGIRKSSENFYLTVYADGWTAPRPEIRVNLAQALQVKKGQALLRIHGTDEVCGFETQIGKGKIIAITTNYVCDVPFFKTVLERLGTKAALSHDYSQYGIFMTTAINDQKERFLHIMNLDDFDKEIHLYENGQKLLDGEKFVIQAKDGVMLPLNILFNGVKIIYSTAEIMGFEKNSIKFRLTQPQDIILLETDRQLISNQDYDVIKNGKRIKIVSKRHAKIHNMLDIVFK